MPKYIHLMFALVACIFVASCDDHDEPSNDNGTTTDQARLSSIYYVEEGMYIFSDPDYDSKGRIIEFTGDVDEEYILLYYADSEAKVKYTYGVSDIIITSGADFSTDEWTYTVSGGQVSHSTGMDKTTPVTRHYSYDSKKCLKTIKEITNDHQYEDYVLSWDNDQLSSIDYYFSNYSDRYPSGHETIAFGNREDHTVIPALVLAWLCEKYHTGVDPFLFYEGYFGTYPSYLPSGVDTYDEDYERKRRISVSYVFNDKGLVSTIIAKVEETEYSRAKTVTLNIGWE